MAPPYYRDKTSGLWGSPTSTMDWCEENYSVTYGIAEFWNTISNLIFIIPPILTIYRMNRAKLLEQRYVVCLLLLALVGIGSFAFHCTLLYEAQLLDELPMVYGTCAMIYCIVEVNSEYNALSKRTVFTLSIISGIISLAYIVLKTPEFFIWSYAILAAALFLLHLKGCLKYEGSMKLLLWSLASYMFGFLLWSIDNDMCYRVRETRTNTPMLFKPMTQLHAWWHIFAGIGTFLCIMFSLHLRLKAQGYEPSLRMICNCIPYYVRGKREECRKVDEYDHNDNHSSSVRGKGHGITNGTTSGFNRLS